MGFRPLWKLLNTDLWGFGERLERATGIEPARGAYGPLPLKIQCGFLEKLEIGAGDGNRTRTASLEGWNSTIELRPQSEGLK